MRHCFLGFVCVFVFFILPTLASADVIEITAKVTSFDDQKNLITVERETPSGVKSYTLEVSPRVSKEVTVEVGDEVYVTYEPTLEIVTKLSKLGEGNEEADAERHSLKPGVREQKICEEVCEKLESQHYLGRSVDRELAQQLVDVYVKALDPMKLYFLQSDIDGFKSRTVGLADQLKDGDTSLGFEIFNRLVDRADERLQEVEELVKQDHDFSKQEQIELDSSAVSWPVDEDRAHERWRKRIKYDMLVLKAEGCDEDEARARISRRYSSFVARLHRQTVDEVLEMFLSSLAQCFDSNSVYMAPSTMKNFEISMRRKLDGIGASLKHEDGRVVVVATVPGGAAALDGRLKQGDWIVGVGQGKSGEFEDTEVMSLNETVNLIRGERGSVVRLKVLPRGLPPSRTYALVRDAIKLTGTRVQGSILEAPSDDAKGRKRRIGVIRVPAFYGSTEDAKGVSGDCRALLEGFELQGIDGVVVDLRNNAGGRLDEIVETVGLFIDRGWVARTKMRNGQVKVLEDTKAGAVWNGALVVLVNRFTAGAAEVFAGAIQDHHRGLVVGSESTAGICNIGSLANLGSSQQGGALKITTGCFYRPEGKGLQQRGVSSDIVLPSIRDSVPSKNSAAAGGIAFDRLPASGFRAVGTDSPSKVSKLRRLSESRMSKSEAFQAIQENIGQDKVSVCTLAEADFLKQWKMREDTVGELREADSSLEQDFYLNEVLVITADFADEISGR